MLAVVLVVGVLPRIDALACGHVRGGYLSCISNDTKKNVSPFRSVLRSPHRLMYELAVGPPLDARSSGRLTA